MELEFSLTASDNYLLAEEQIMPEVPASPSTLSYSKHPDPPEKKNQWHFIILISS